MISEFTDDSMLRRVHREWVVAFSGPRALLMQATHPVAFAGFFAHTGALDDLESGIRDWLIATGADGGFEGDPSQPAGGSGASSTDEVLDRLDLVLERITALDQRVDDICDGVPVC